MDNFLFLPRATVSALYDLCFAFSTGILLCRAWLPETGTAHLHPRLRIALRTAALLLFLSLVAQIFLTTATMVGSAAPKTVLPQLQDVLTATHAGRMAAAAILPSIALLALAFAGQASRATRFTTLTILFLLAILRSATGHAAASGDFTLDEAAQLLHLTATAVWAGIILAAGLVIAPRLRKSTDAPTLTHLGQRVSRFATVAIVLILTTGVYKSWRGLEGKLAPLVHTRWGILLAVKSGLVVLALALGLTNRLLLNRNAQLFPEDAAQFAKSLRLEAFLMIAILTLSAFLANSPPATS